MKTLAEMKTYSEQWRGTINTACKLITPLFPHVIYSKAFMSPRSNLPLLLFHSLMRGVMQNWVPHSITFYEFQLWSKRRGEGNHSHYEKQIAHFAMFRPNQLENMIVWPLFDNTTILTNELSMTVNIRIFFLPHSSAPRIGCILPFSKFNWLFVKTRPL